MIARIARTLLLLQLAVVAALAATIHSLWLPGHFWAALALGLCAVLLLRGLLTANTFFLSRANPAADAHVHGQPHAAQNSLELPGSPGSSGSSGPSVHAGEPDYKAAATAGRLDLPARCGLFLQEVGASLLCTSLAMPFRQFDKRLGGSRACPVLLLHGYGCNSGYWYRMSQTLQSAGITHYAIDLEPVLGSIDLYAQPIDAAMRRIQAETGSRRLIIVGHSMGGLAARAYMRDYGDAALAGIITLGTPHHGTRLANFGMGVNSGEMRWLETVAVEAATAAGLEPNGQERNGSNWLRALDRSETMPDTIARRRRIVSIYSAHDNIVAPQRSSHLPHARNIAVQAVGHVALALDPKIQQLVIQEITRMSAAAH